MHSKYLALGGVVTRAVLPCRRYAQLVILHFFFPIEQDSMSNLTALVAFGEAMHAFGALGDSVSLATACQHVPMYIRTISPQQGPVLAVMELAESTLHARVQDFLAACDAAKAEFW